MRQCCRILDPVATAAAGQEGSGKRQEQVKFLHEEPEGDGRAPFHRRSSDHRQPSLFA
jgi:hypothetical protein